MSFRDSKVKDVPGTVTLLLLLFRNSQELARPMPFFELFHDLLELLTELASDPPGGEDGLDTITCDSSDISEYTLFRDTLWFRSRRGID